MERKIVKDVSVFLNECSEAVGSFEHDSFSVDAWNEFYDLEIESPIEQIFYAAFKTLARFNLLDNEPFEHNGQDCLYAVGIQPQLKIGKFRVDFYTFFEDTGRKIRREVIVECDSQQFHDRSEDERRYEKARDRFLQTSGYKVFRFTGKEIKDEPFRVAGEVFAYLLDRKIEDVLDVNYIPEKYQ